MEIVLAYRYLHYFLAQAKLIKANDAVGHEVLAFTIDWLHAFCGGVLLHVPLGVVLMIEGFDYLCCYDCILNLALLLSHPASSSESVEHFNAALLSVRPSTIAPRGQTAPDQLDSTNANYDAYNQRYEHRLVCHKVDGRGALPIGQHERLLIGLLQVADKEVNVHTSQLLGVKAEFDATIVTESCSSRLHDDKLVANDCGECFTISCLAHSDVYLLVGGSHVLALDADLVRLLRLQMYRVIAEVVGRYRSALLEAVRPGAIGVLASDYAQRVRILRTHLIMLEPFLCLECFDRACRAVLITLAGTSLCYPLALACCCSSCAVEARLEELAAYRR